MHLLHPFLLLTSCAVLPPGPRPIVAKHCLVVENDGNYLSSARRNSTGSPPLAASARHPSSLRRPERHQAFGKAKVAHEYRQIPPGNVVGEVARLRRRVRGGTAHLELGIEIGNALGARIVVKLKRQRQSSRKAARGVVVVERNLMHGVADAHFNRLRHHLASKEKCQKNCCKACARRTNQKTLSTHRRRLIEKKQRKPRSGPACSRLCAAGWAP